MPSAALCRPLVACSLALAALGFPDPGSAGPAPAGPTLGQAPSETLEQTAVNMAADPGGDPGADPTASPEPGPGPGLGPVTNLPLPRYVSMRADSANARRGPGLDQRVDWEFLKRGLPLRITAEYGQWRRVEDADGATGWVHQALLSGTRTALVRSPGAVPLRADPDEAAATRALAEPGVIARVESCAADWCEVSASGFDGWLPRAALWGVDPGETLD